MKADIIVIGGGASGLAAAICAARQGASVLILERMARIGKKLLANAILQIDLWRFTVITAGNLRWFARC